MEISKQELRDAMGDVLARLKATRQKTDGPRSERDELVQKFTDRLNVDRVRSGRKPYPARVVAVKLSLVKTDELWFFYQLCDRANNFGAYFHWALKPSKKKS